MEEKVNNYGVAEAPFSSAVRTDALLFVSGQGACDPDTGLVLTTDLEGQTLQTFRNIERILAGSGLSLRDIVKVNVYLLQRKYYEEFNQIYARILTPPYPARTLVYCELNFNLLVEIDVIAKLRA